METAYFAAGCFWGVEDKFMQLEGVLETQVGYMGGKTTDPTYEEVCQGQSFHAETVKIDFDPGVISYGELLEVFFQIHDPTTLNAQGPDRGTQYRSAIFPLNQEQKDQAQAKIVSLNEAYTFSKPIVTTLEELAPFYPAEEYHQKYLQKRN